MKFLFFLDGGTHRQVFFINISTTVYKKTFYYNYGVIVSLFKKHFYLDSRAFAESTCLATTIGL